jgi:uridine kinase
MDQMKEYEILFSKIEKLLAEKERVVVALDGGAASGKTTLADLLAKRYGGKIVHMDDFFLRPEQRTPERFAEAGGNFDRERFLEEVIPFIGKKETFSYRIFDCSKMCLFGNAEISDSALVIVEGSYSHHPAFADTFDLRVFLHVDEAERKRRIIERNGEMSKMFFNRWIPLENRYFEAFQIEEKADLVIGG